jgi:hypothetical protein
MRKVTVRKNPALRVGTTEVTASIFCSVCKEVMEAEVVDGAFHYLPHPHDRGTVALSWRPAVDALELDQ